MSILLEHEDGRIYKVSPESPLFRSGALEELVDDLELKGNLVVPYRGRGFGGLDLLESYLENPNISLEEVSVEEIVDFLEAANYLRVLDRHQIGNESFRSTAFLEEFRLEVEGTLGLTNELTALSDMPNDLFCNLVQNAVISRQIFNFGILNWCRHLQWIVDNKYLLLVNPELTDWLWDNVWDINPRGNIQVRPDESIDGPRPGSLWEFVLLQAKLSDREFSTQLPLKSYRRNLLNDWKSLHMNDVERLVFYDFPRIEPESLANRGRGQFLSIALRGNNIATFVQLLQSPKFQMFRAFQDHPMSQVRRPEGVQILRDTNLVFGFPQGPQDLRDMQQNQDALISLSKWVPSEFGWFLDLLADTFTMDFLEIIETLWNHLVLNPEVVDALLDRNIEIPWERIRFGLIPVENRLEVFRVAMATTDPEVRIQFLPELSWDDLTNEMTEEDWDGIPEHFRALYAGSEENLSDIDWSTVELNEVQRSYLLHRMNFPQFWDLFNTLLAKEDWDRLYHSLRLFAFGDLGYTIQNFDPKDIEDALVEKDIKYIRGETRSQLLARLVIDQTLKEMQTANLLPLDRSFGVITVLLDLSL